MKEKLTEPEYELQLNLEERIALAAIVKYDGGEAEIAEQAADDVPNQLDIQKEEFAATIRNLVNVLSDLSLQAKIRCEEE